MRRFITLSICLALILSSCHKEKFPTRYVPDSLKQMVPYRDADVIQYANASGSILNVRIGKEGGFIEKSTCVGCEPYEREETIGYVFYVGVKTLVRLSIDTRPFIFMTIYSPEDNYQIGGGFDFATVEGVPLPLCSPNLPRQKCLSSVTLNGKIYYNVLEANNFTTAPKELSKAYYTVEKGLVAFSYGNGNTYSLSP
ncbi:hypothetical protein [Segetibacter sp.]|jgi:hypothetical protein|uniref:hypothetical protein n=1 Tax=Segetibacter sp. TaxID=2231182 RepID=UPI00261D29D9|nr:hypothetical protein [Segetibacter sp.]MCW3080618.1 hypothetical protein [Segetibacter sp.]